MDLGKMKNYSVACIGTKNHVYSAAFEKGGKTTTFTVVDADGRGEIKKGVDEFKVEDSKTRQATMLELNSRNTEIARYIIARLRLKIRRRIEYAKGRFAGEKKVIDGNPYPPVCGKKGPASYRTLIAGHVFRTTDIGGDGRADTFFAFGKNSIILSAADVIKMAPMSSDGGAFDVCNLLYPRRGIFGVLRTLDEVFVKDQK